MLAEPAERTSISERIADRIDQMPAGERRAAQTLIANYPLIGLRTVAEFAQQAGVSSPTILRFVARLGFQNYPDFQAALQAELAAQIQSPLSRTASAEAVAPSEAGRIANAAIENIRETFQHISEKQFTAVSAALADPRGKIYLAGGRFSDSIARYLAAHLALIRPGVVHLTGQESGWHDKLADMGRRDAMVIFDIRRYQAGLADFSEKAARRGATIILLTDQWVSPIARFARHVIPVRTASPSAWDSSAALFVLAEALIDSVTRARADEGAKRMRDIESFR
ncbi:MAG: MurR/RpiR family transcriptional regulator [Rhizobiaceae bacterium]|nr:MurR/RpiR family transcriptional regulator [Rhizobiaceae bacterium]